MSKAWQADLRLPGLRRQRSITVTICGIARSGGYTAVPLAERLAFLDLVLRYFDKYWHNLKFLKS